jgi:hypothetical protein
MSTGDTEPCMSVRRAKVSFFSGCNSHLATVAPACRNRSGRRKSVGSQNRLTPNSFFLDDNFLKAARREGVGGHTRVGGQGLGDIQGSFSTLAYPPGGAGAKTGGRGQQYLVIAIQSRLQSDIQCSIEPPRTSIPDGQLDPERSLRFDYLIDSVCFDVGELITGQLDAQEGGHADQCPH